MRVREREGGRKMRRRGASKTDRQKVAGEGGWTDKQRDGQKRREIEEKDRAIDFKLIIAATTV